RWTLTSFGFALTLPTDVGCFKFSARPFVRAHPHFAQVRAWHPDHRLMLPVRARTLTSFGFALTLRPDVKRFKFSVRCFVRTPFVSAQFSARSSVKAPPLYKRGKKNLVLCDLSVRF